MWRVSPRRPRCRRSCRRCRGRGPRCRWRCCTPRWGWRPARRPSCPTGRRRLGRRLGLLRAGLGAGATEAAAAEGVDVTGREADAEAEDPDAVEVAGDLDRDGDGRRDRVARQDAVALGGRLGLLRTGDGAAAGTGGAGPEEQGTEAGDETGGCDLAEVHGVSPCIGLHFGDAWPATSADDQTGRAAPGSARAAPEGAAGSGPWGCAAAHVPAGDRYDLARARRGGPGGRRSAGGARWASRG